MKLRFFLRRDTVRNISKLNGRAFYQHSSGYRCVAAAVASAGPTSPHHGGLSFLNTRGPKPKAFDNQSSRRWIQTSGQVELDESETESEDDATMNEFLSRFVWLMRKKVVAAFPECDKDTINGMLIIIVENVVSEMEKGGLQQILGAGNSMPSEDFSEDLWRTVWEVSNVVLQDMEKEKRKEKMKIFLQSEEVKEMYRFAGEVGIRGDMLRELRFKWAREKMEKSDFYEALERMRKEEAEKGKDELDGGELVGEKNVVEGEEKSVSLPKRHGKIKYKIYGLDLSNPKWVKVANKIHESSKGMWPEEPKPVTDKAKFVTEKILSLKDEDDPAPLLSEWKDVLQPNRIDWAGLLDKLEEQNSHLYLKIAEFLLGEDSFEANQRDYSKLIDAHAKENRLEDAERILKNMKDRGILPDATTSAILVTMYQKAGNLNRAKEEYDSCLSSGFRPDLRLFSSMIMAYINANKPDECETIRRTMELMKIQPTKEIYMALLQSYAKLGNTIKVNNICSSILCSESFKLDIGPLTSIVEAYGRVGDYVSALSYFNRLTTLGVKPEDKCTASVIAAYEKHNVLDEALKFLCELENDGFEPGVATYTVLVDWFSKLGLFEEAQQLLDRIAEQGEAPPFKLHVSLCDMYIKSGAEKKALQALGVLESKIDELESEDFERVIASLTDGGFIQDAQRMHELMESRGFILSQNMKIRLMSKRVLKRGM